ncbi:MAG: hypothetical protein JWN44_1535 [Myxococcales bacterium]|nr:hypothetical protein [Myxococcales bacterium]
MKGLVMGLGVVSLLAMAGMGCRTVDEKSAQYHSWRAERAADKGNYEKAREQRLKAEKAKATIPTDPLP